MLKQLMVNTMIRLTFEGIIS